MNARTHLVALCIVLPALFGVVALVLGGPPLRHAAEGLFVALAVGGVKLVVSSVLDALLPSE